MSDFDKKKPNIKNDTDTDEIYEIPDIVTGGFYRLEFPDNDTPASYP